MAELAASSRADPLNAPLRRKLLAARVLLLSAVGVALSIFLIDWLDHIKLGLPKWLETTLIIAAALPFFAFIFALKEGIPDLIVHFIPDGRLKQLLLWGDRSPEVIAHEFEQSGYAIALAPFFIPLAIALLTVLLLLLAGSFALIGNLLDAVFAGWPSWAVVITLLLIAILLKK